MLGNPPGSRERGSPRQLLLVEDNPGDIELIRAMLDDQWHVETVTTLKEAMDALDRRTFDVIVTDLGLPDARSFESLQRLILRAPTVPVVVLTGRRETEIGPQAVAAGAQDFVSKDDLNEEVLTRTLRYAIERTAWLSQLQAVVAHNSDAIVVVDHEGLVRFANPAAHALLRPAGATLVDAPFGFDIEPGQTREIVLDHAGDTARYAEVRASTVVWEGRPAKVVSMRDTSDRKRAEALQHQLAHADRLAAVGRLAAGVAHEVSNPATFVLGNFELLADILDDLAGSTASLGGELRTARLEEGHAMLRDCRSGVRRIVRLVKDLRAFSRREEESVETLDLVEVVETACRMTSNEIRHRARLIRELDPLPRIVGDRSKLEQVFTNLLLNAAQSIEAGHVNANHVKVSTAVRDGRAIVTVEDTGCGIPAGEQGHIFEPFFTTKDRDAGTGLGLALSSDIVRLHGGQLAFESAEGRGSRFSVAIPVERSAPVATPQPSWIAQERARRRVLFVDDERQLLTIYEKTLGRFHDVTTSASALDAVEIAAGAGFDAILCDVMMPDIDGVEFYDALLARDPDAASRIVFCTGGVFTTRAQVFLENVDNPVLEKPFTIEAALDLIERVATRSA